jgi:lipoate synthase
MFIILILCHLVVQVASAGLDVYAHNIETVTALSLLSINPKEV